MLRTILTLVILQFILYNAVRGSISERSDLTVYDDYLENGWENQSTLQVNFKSKDITYYGKYSISFTPIEDKHFRLTCEHCMDTLIYTSLDFHLLLSQEEDISDIIINFYQRKSLVSSILLSQLYPNILQDTNRWMLISINFEAVGIPAGMGLTGFSLEGGISDGGKNKIYLDEIALKAIHGNYDPSGATSNDGFRVYSNAISNGHPRTKISLSGEITNTINVYHHPSNSDDGDNEGQQWLLSAFSLFIFCSVLGIVATAVALLLLFKKGYVIVHEGDVKTREPPSPPVELKQV